MGYFAAARSGRETDLSISSLILRSQGLRPETSTNQPVIK